MTHGPIAAARVAPRLLDADFRAALGMFATGVTIVTARDAAGDAGRPHRELVQLGVARAAAGAVEPGAPAPARCRRSSAARTTRSTSWPPTSTRSPSASPRKDVDRFDGVAVPRRARAARRCSTARRRCFECFNRSRYEEGDHVIFVGEVEQCARRAGRAAAHLPRRALLHRAAAVASPARRSRAARGEGPARRDEPRTWRAAEAHVERRAPARLGPDRRRRSARSSRAGCRGGTARSDAGTGTRARPRARRRAEEVEHEADVAVLRVELRLVEQVHERRAASLRAPS